MRSVPLPFLSKITLLWTRAREPGPVSPVKVDSPLPFPRTQRGEIYKKHVRSCGTLPFTRPTMKNCGTSHSEIPAKRKSTVVNDRAPSASERCVATDESVLKGFGDVSQTSDL